MKFSEYEYQRPNLKEVQSSIEEWTRFLEKAKNDDDVLKAIEAFNDIRNHFLTAQTLVSIRYSLNTTDPFYEAEQAFMDESTPEVEAWINGFFKALVKSPYLGKAKSQFGDHFLKLIEVSLKAFDEAIIEELKKENQLSSQYTKLRSSAKIPFKGEILNLAQMGPHYEDPDPEVRKEANLATSQFFADNLEAFDDLYDQLVKVRHEMAVKMGFETYTPLGYLRLSRVDYDANDVANYRKQVLEDLVPLATELRKKQGQRLGVEKLAYSDEAIAFLSGNAKPLGTPDDILKSGQKMYHELSSETGEFIDYMYEHELMDVVAREGKSGGGYCTYISDYKSPYIFSNFNGTSGDVDVLTHEAGHAFQVFSSRDYEMPEYLFPTLEACEIHSMSMEFITWPWMNLFFGDHADKYRYHHLTSGILFLPYGVLVDEFQHEVYANPMMTPQDRRQLWARLEKQYLPHRDYEDDAFLKSGGFWFRQGHIFSNPFYYIDYTLAQVCAFQFHIANQEDHEKTWQRYLDLCKLGGSASFLDLIKAVDLRNPFEDQTIKTIVSPLKEWLEKQPDHQF